MYYVHNHKSCKYNPRQVSRGSKLHTIRDTRHTDPRGCRGGGSSTTRRRRGRPITPATHLITPSRAALRRGRGPWRSGYYHATTNPTTTTHKPTQRDPKPAHNHPKPLPSALGDSPLCRKKRHIGECSRAFGRRVLPRFGDFRLSPSASASSPKKRRLRRTTAASG